VTASDTDLLEDRADALLEGDRVLETSAARAALQSRDFRVVWVGAALSNVGTWMQNVTLGALAFELTHSPTFVSVVTFAQLGPLLAQFPASFHNDARSRAHLAALLRAFHGYTLCVELRHRTWNTEGIEALLDGFGAAWVQIDEPKFKDSVQHVPAAERAPLVYLRLHGRNARTWWNHAHRDDRYDYDYSKEELEPFAKTLARAEGRAYAALNNHPRAQAVANAKTLKQLVEEMTAADTANVPAVRPSPE